jgi:hypothetical protein
MVDSVGPGQVASSKNLYFTLSKTPRDQPVDITQFPGNYVIELDGEIYKLSDPPPNTAAITIVGGIDTFANEKEYRPYMFYLTQRQKVTLYKIMKELSKTTDRAQVHSDDSLLDHLLTNTYTNYCG